MKVLLPEVLDINFVLQGPTPEGWCWDLEKEAIVIQAAGRVPQHVEPIAQAALSAWAEHLRRQGCPIHVDESLRSRYMWKIGLLGALNKSAPWSDDVTPTEDYFPLCQIRDERRAEMLSESAVLTLNIRDRIAKDKVSHAIAEIARNAEQHSKSLTPTVFSAGYFRTQRRITFAVADTGRGILAALRQKKVATFEDDDATAIEKAIHEFVTGAGKPGIPSAPENAGLGLHTTRWLARDCAGEMVILSGHGVFWESGTDEGRLFNMENGHFWKGVLVCVTLRPHQLGAFARRSSATGLGPHEGGYWRNDPPAGALLLEPPVDRARFASDKGWYREQRHRVENAIGQGQMVHVDFGKAIYTTQGAVHSLLAEPIRIHGPAALRLLSFGQGGQPLREAVMLVINYALGNYEQEKLGGEEE